MSIEKAVKTMLENISNTIIPNDSIAFMMVAEGTPFPIIEYNITSIEDLVIGTPTNLRKAIVQISSVDESNPDAKTLSEAVEGVIIPGTYDGINVQAIINRNTIFESASYDHGDESSPAVAITTVELIYS